MAATQPSCRDPTNSSGTASLPERTSCGRRCNRTKRERPTSCTLRPSATDIGALSSRVSSEKIQHSTLSRTSCRWSCRQARGGPCVCTSAGSTIPAAPYQLERGDVDAVRAGAVSHRRTAMATSSVERWKVVPRARKQAFIDVSRALIARWKRTWQALEVRGSARCL